MTQIYTVGYEGRSIETFVALLEQHGIEVLADVRELPLSRKKGFSKTALGNALSDAGIAYLHLKELGNPKAIRKSGKPLDEVLAAYDEHMEERWDTALTRALAVAQEKRTALMCFELEPCECHRTSVAKQLAARLGVDVVEI